MGNSIIVGRMDQSERTDGRLRDPVASHLGYRLRRASAAVMAALGAALAEIGLRPVEGTILILVGANPGCIQSDVGRMLGIKRANMTPLIAALSAKGWLDKAPVDGRSLSLTLTRAGEHMCRRVETIMAAHEARVERILAGRDVESVRESLRLLAQEGQADAD